MIRSTIAAVVLAVILATASGCKKTTCTDDVTPGPSGQSIVIAHCR